MRRLYLDTEFVETTVRTDTGRLVPIVDLISIALVDDNGASYYAVSNEFDRDAALNNSFVRQHVLPSLPPQSEWKPLEQIHREIRAFIGHEPALYCYWDIAHDVVLLQQLFGDNMNARAANLRGDHINLKQLFNEMGRPDVLPIQRTAKHIALNDAHWARQVGNVLWSWLARDQSCFRPDRYASDMVLT